MPSLIVLAAGQGTRMNSEKPKVLHELGGLALFGHALRAGAAIDPFVSVLVVGPEAEDVKTAARKLDPTIEIVEQTERLGTGHAVAQTRKALEKTPGPVFVLFGDTPFITPQTLRVMAQTLEKNAVVVLGFETENPTGYGRLVIKNGHLERIVEEKDATPAERALTLCNSGVIAASSEILFELVGQLDNDNESQEYYLTDIVELARAQNLSAAVVTCPQSETMGINTRSELAKAEAIFQSNARAQALADGVTLVAPETVFFSYDTVLGRDSIIEPNVVFGPNVSVETGAHIRAFCHLEGAHVSKGAVVGPYARLRPGAELAEEVRIGNFVEIKNARLDTGAKVNHLSYIGDAEIGQRSNIGAGTVTCNYDGVNKHQTVIGEEVFVGSDTMLVAPVKIGDGAMTASGSVITRNVDAGDLAVGRARQENKPGFATRFFGKLRQLKKEKS